MVLSYAIGVDEIQYAKGQYLTLVYQIDIGTTRLLWIGKDRTIESNAVHILDRFHIMANMNKALDKVRAEETSRMKREGHAPVLKKSRWLRLRGAGNRTGQIAARIDF
jgi:transposase